jgi:Family of unknown function (DUF6496)
MPCTAVSIAPVSPCSRSAKKDVKERDASVQEGHAEKRQMWLGRQSEEPPRAIAIGLPEARKKGNKVSKHHKAKKKSGK